MKRSRESGNVDRSHGALDIGLYLSFRARASLRDERKRDQRKKEQLGQMLAGESSALNFHLRHRIWHLHRIKPLFLQYERHNGEMRS